MGERHEEDRAGWVAWHSKGKDGADERTRTADLLITSELLYQLSYVGLNSGRRNLSPRLGGRQA